MITRPGDDREGALCCLWTVHHYTIKLIFLTMKVSSVFSFGRRWFLQGTHFVFQVHHGGPESSNVLAEHNLLLSGEFAKHIFDLGRHWIHHCRCSCCGGGLDSYEYSGRLRS